MTIKVVNLSQNMAFLTKNFLRFHTENAELATTKTI